MNNTMWITHTPKFEYETMFSDFNKAWAGHKIFAYDLVANVKPRTIVELGTYKGTSFFSFCQAVKDLNLKTRLYAVDSWQGDPHAGFYDDQVFKKFIEIKERFYHGLEISPINETFDDALKYVKDNSIDLLHIDGYHTYQAVKHDFETWLPKVASNAIILFHDTNEHRDDFGVYRLWEELTNIYPNNFSFFHSHGLGVLFFGSSDKYLQLLLKEALDIKEYYSLISERDKYIGLYKQYSSLNGLLEKMMSRMGLDVEDFEQDMQKFKEMIDEITKQVEENKKKIEQVKHSVTWKTGRVVLFPAIFFNALIHKILSLYAMKKP